MPSEATPTRDFDIRVYLEILLHRKWIVVATLVLVVAGAYFKADSQPRLYSASGDMLFTRRTTAGAIEGAFSLSNSANPQRSLATDVRLILSSEVRTLATRFYPQAGFVSAQAAPDVDVITVSSVSADPKNTVKTVNAYLLAFIEYRRVSALDDVLAAQEVLNQRIERFQQQINDIDARAAKATEQQRAAMATQKTTLMGQQDVARQQIDRLQEGINFQDTTRILRQPSEPAAPFSPNPQKSATQAAIVGLLLGVGFAFLRDVLDDSIKTKADLTRAAPRLSILATIPTVSAPKLAPNELASITRPDSNVAEAYRSLRTSIQFMSLDRPIRLVQMTSPVASEGKTTTLANLAVALASIGQRVIVVCCDLRRPRVHELFGLSNEVGFTSVLLGTVSLSGALQPVPGVPRLRVLASGKPPPNPAELLAGTRAEKLFAALAADADIVLVDSPPVLPVTDAAVIANRVDATILVASAAKSLRKHVSHAIEVLSQVDSHIVGAVLNEAPSEVGGYGYGYDEYRGSTEPDPPAAPASRPRQPDAQSSAARS